MVLETVILWGRCAGTLFKENMMRRYGAWAGEPKGYSEDVTLCVAEVTGRAITFYQCSRKRGHGPDGLYCKQHANKLAAGNRVFVPNEKP